MKLGPILQRHDFHLKKRLGQHFLVDDRVLQAIVTAAEIRPGDRVLEVGPGAGSLTRALALAGASVAAVELDRSLEPVLREVLGELAVTVVWGDALRIELPAADKVVANLPYNLTAPLMARLLSGGPYERLVLMLQKEVAERALAAPGTRAYGAFTLLVRYYARPELVTRVPAGAFLPPPQVDSAVLRLWPEQAPYPQQAFFTVVRQAFGQRRKMLINTVGEPLVTAAGIDGRRRGETLSLEEFGNLAVACHRLLAKERAY